MARSEAQLKLSKKYREQFERKMPLWNALEQFYVFHSFSKSKPFGVWRENLVASAISLYEI